MLAREKQRPDIQQEIQEKSGILCNPMLTVLLDFMAERKKLILNEGKLFGYLFFGGSGGAQDPALVCKSPSLIVCYEPPSLVFLPLWGTTSLKKAKFS